MTTQTVVRTPTQPMLDQSLEIGSVESPVDILIGARQLLTDSGHWIRWTRAKRVDGVGVSATSREAVSWCALGAIQCATNLCDSATGFNRYEREAQSYLIQAITDTDVQNDYKLREEIAKWNNSPSTSHQDILNGFDRAIALAEQEERMP